MRPVVSEIANSLSANLAVNCCAQLIRCQNLKTLLNRITNWLGFPQCDTLFRKTQPLLLMSVVGRVFDEAVWLCVDVILDGNKKKRTFKSSTLLYTLRVRSR